MKENYAEILDVEIRKFFSYSAEER